MASFVISGLARALMPLHAIEQASAIASNPSQSQDFCVVLIERGRQDTTLVDSAFEHQTLKQDRDRGPFVGFLSTGFLTQNQSSLASKGANQEQGLLPGLPATPTGLAVNGPPYFQTNSGAHSPRSKTFFDRAPIAIKRTSAPRCHARACHFLRPESASASQYALFPRSQCRRSPRFRRPSHPPRSAASRPNRISNVPLHVDRAPLQTPPLRATVNSDHFV